MGLQLLVVALIVAGAAGYLAWAIWRSARNAKSGCGGGCGCGGKARAQTPQSGTNFVSSEQLVARLRQRDTR
jgi:hypothetical protein